MIQDYQIAEISEVIKRFGTSYGENFSKFAEQFYNYKLSYELVNYHLLSIMEGVRNAADNLPISLKNYIGLDRYKNLQNTENFINTLESNIRYMAFNNIKLSDKTVPEKNSRLIEGIKKEDFLGIPNGWNVYIQNEMNELNNKLKVNPNSNIIVWDLLFAKLLHFDSDKFKKIDRDIFMKIDSAMHERSINEYFQESDMLSDCRDKCHSVLNNSPVTAMRKMHRMEYSMVLPGCKKRLIYISKRFNTNDTTNSLIKNIPNAGQIAKGEKLKQEKTPNMIESISGIINILKNMKMPTYDDVSRHETIRDFNMALECLKEKESLERFGLFFQNQPHLAFMSIFLIKKLHEMDNMVFQKISEKFR
ncbi:MAG TPA: hypothetical protein PLZ05_03190 [Alphaproteobacteria bacterium]|nr:hypothetical protein [Alphaproteobacteria bacterium]